MSKVGKQLIEAAQEALAIATGEEPAASVTINGHTYHPAHEIALLRAENARLKREINGYAKYAGETSDQFVAASALLRTQLAEARREALEEAAKVADGEVSRMGVAIRKAEEGSETRRALTACSGMAFKIAAAIRAFKEQP